MAVASRLARMRGHAPRLLLAMILALQFQCCSTWFMYGELGWRREPGDNTVHFTLHTSWDRRGFPAVVSRLTAGEDVESFNSAWQAGVAAGHGAVLPVTEGATETVRRAIGFGDGQTLSAGSDGTFDFIITRLDDEVVHASLDFSHTYAPGAYTAYFEGCCRGLELQNNAGGSWHVRSAVTLLDDGALGSPALTLPAMLRLPRPVEGDNTAVQLAGLPAASSYELADSDGLGLALDTRLGDPYDSIVYAQPAGIALSTGGELSLRIPSTCAGQTRCLLQAALQIEHRNASRGVDFTIEVVPNEAPVANFQGFFVTAQTSVVSPVTIACGTPAFVPPTNSTYKVSACIDLDELNTFTCSGMTGVCPARSYAFIHPFNLPVYSNCFALDACPGGQQRLYCTDIEEVGASSEFLRVKFASPLGRNIARIRQVSELPTGAVVVGDCDDLGNCAGAALLGSSAGRYVDLVWTPNCDEASQLGTFAACFTAEDSEGLVSAPSCVVVESRDGDMVVRAPEEGATYTLPAAQLDDAHLAPPLAMSTWQLAVFRNPAHSIAEEAMIAQPQVAVLDPQGALVRTTAGMRVTAAIGLNPGGGTMTGTTVMDIVNGVAAFTDLTVSHEGKGYTLVFTTPGLDGAMETPRFTVLPPVRLARVGVQPGETMVAGQRVQGPPQVYLLDRDENFVAFSAREVSVALVGAAGLMGVTTVKASSGVAVFHDLRLSTAGEYSLQFAVAPAAGGPAIPPVASRTVTVVAGAAQLLYVVQQPCARSGTSGCSDPDNHHQVAKDLFETAVQLYDSFYNRVEDAPSGARCKVSLNRFPPRPIDGFLQGTREVSFEGGVARFEDLSIREQGFYSITFTVDTTVTTIVNTTIVFDVQLPVARPPDVVQQPLLAVAGTVLGGPPRIALLDSYGFRTESQRPVMAVLESSNSTPTCAAMCLDTESCVAAPNRTCEAPAEIISGATAGPLHGLADFEAVLIRRAGRGYHLQFLASEELFSFSAAFDVTPAAPARLVLPRLPARVILGEPFGVQPLVALIDAFGNVALDESSGFVVASLAGADAGGFELIGFERVAIRAGEAMFHNLGVDEDGVAAAGGAAHEIEFAFGGFAVSTGPFAALPSLQELAVEAQPGATVAGVIVAGAPAVGLLDPQGNRTALSNRTVSVRVKEAGCPARFPAPNNATQLLTQAELRGALPVAVGEPLVLTRFLSVGFPAGGGQVAVSVVDGAFECDSFPDPAVGAIAGGEPQQLLCGDDGACRAAGDEASEFLQFSLTAMSPSGTLRVCAKAPGAPGAVVALVMHQRASLKLHTRITMVVSRGARSLATDRSEPMDAAVLWYAGATADACHGFRVTASDPRVAVVRASALEESLLAGRTYQCPHDPRTGQRFRWASSNEVRALGTLFRAGAAPGPLYPDASCGGAPERDAFAFSDSLATGLYASAEAPEAQNLTRGGGDGTLAGLVCLLDEGDALDECVGLCPGEACAEHEPAVVYEDAAQGLVLSLLSYEEAGAVGAVRAPEFEGHLDPRLGGNVVALAEGRVGLRLALQREPASWVRVTVSPRGSLSGTRAPSLCSEGGARAAGTLTSTVRASTRTQSR